MATDRREVAAASPAYREFVRLYRIARTMRPISSADPWNGKLYARSDDVWGSVHPTTRAVSLNEHRVLPYLTGQRSQAHPGSQARALQTVLHEAYHQRVPTNASHPNAFRGKESAALDEGLTEHQAFIDLRPFSVRTGYGRLTPDGTVYPGAVTATTQLLDYAVGPGSSRNDLASRALDQPVVMRWDTIADEIVRTRLSTVVPSDPRHQQATRAVLVMAMTHPSWRDLHNYGEAAGHLAAHHTTRALDTAIRQVQRHYRTNPAEPIPTTPTQPTADLGIEQARTGQADPALHAALSGQAAATDATRTIPSLGDGAHRTHTPVLSSRAITVSSDR